jgi:2-amino-4-hydroxy-6-hydroxymethyldihydropteridine diphosphokinase
VHLPQPYGRGLIALGTNVPFDGLAGGALLARAAAALEAAGLAVTARSSVWISEAWPPGTDQADYANAVVEVDANGLAPQQLYQTLRSVEQAFGRERRIRWGPRTLDLDILAMAGLTGAFYGVELPHPRLQERAFVLAPMAEIAPDWRHPALGLTPGDLLERLAQSQACRRLGPLLPG